jgi:nucleoid-associated protein YejK
MKNPQHITISSLIVHILDNQKAPPKAVLSDDECVLSAHITDFFISHIEKSLSDDRAKVASFRQSDGRVSQLAKDTFKNGGHFVQNSKDLANLLFTPMGQNRAISAGDMVVCVYTAENLPGKFLGIFKMDLAEAFRHKVVTQGRQTSIQITPLTNVLPGPEQKLQKCVFIRPPDPEYDMVVLDNQIVHLSDRPGVANFFCKTFLDCNLSQTDRDKTKLFQTLTSKWASDREKEGRLDQAQADVIVDTAIQAIRSDVVNIPQFAGAVIPDQALRQDFQETLRQKTLQDAEFVPDKEYVQKITTKKRYIADFGITVSGDAEQFDKVVGVGNVRDANGQITVTIKTTRWTPKVR